MIDTAEPRVQPRAIDAERAILGSILLHGVQSLDEVADLLTPGDFWNPPHGRIFAAAERTMERGVVDTTTVAHALETSGELDQVGGREILVALLGEAAGPATVRRHAEIVLDAAIRRKLSGVGTEIADLARDPGTPAEQLLDAATERILGIGRIDSGPALRSLGEITREAIDAAERAQRTGCAPSGLRSGYPCLDQVVGGFREAELVVLAARPSMGKTSLAINIADRIAEGGGGVLFLSLEMSAGQIAANLLASRARVTSDQLRRGSLSADEFDRVREAHARISETAFLIQDPSELTPARLRSLIRRAQREAGELNLVVIDYLQLMHGGQRFESRQQEVSTISRSLKAAAKATGIPILTLAQLNRDVEKRGRDDRKPRMSDLRESGAIEQDADVILLLHREDYYNPTADTRELASVIVAKNRNGNTGDVTLRFVREHTRFESWQSRPEAMR